MRFSKCFAGLDWRDEGIPSDTGSDSFAHGHGLSPVTISFVLPPAKPVGSGNPSFTFVTTNFTQKTGYDSNTNSTITIYDYKFARVSDVRGKWDCAITSSKVTRSESCLAIPAYNNMTRLRNSLLQLRANVILWANYRLAIQIHWLMYRCLTLLW